MVVDTNHDIMRAYVDGLATYERLAPTTAHDEFRRILCIWSTVEVGMVGEVKEGEEMVEEVMGEVELVVEMEVVEKVEEAMVEATAEEATVEVE